MGRLKASERIKKRKELLLEVADELDALDEYMNKKYSKLVEENLDAIGRIAIDMYYEDEVFDDGHGGKTNEPKMYRREYDLYNVYKIKINKNGFEVDLDSKYMKYHSSNKDYIYQKMFVEGYHGGYDKEIHGYHPDPGTPWWHYTMTSDGQNEQKITKGWIVWIKEAPRSPSPHDYMVSEMNKEITRLSEEYDSEYIEKATKIIKKLRKYKK